MTKRKDVMLKYNDAVEIGNLLMYVSNAPSGFKPVLKMAKILLKAIQKSESETN